MHYLSVEAGAARNGVRVSEWAGRLAACACREAGGDAVQAADARREAEGEATVRPGMSEREARHIGERHARIDIV